jgi:hypothetical protein
VVVATRVVIILQRGALKDSEEKIASALESAATANALRALGVAVRYPPAINSRVAAGVFVIFPASMNRFERDAISAILSKAGMQTEGSPERTWLPPGDFPEDQIVIFVGQKPLPNPVGAEPAGK